MSREATIKDDAEQQTVPAALFRDPPPDLAALAQTLPQAIPSHGVNLNAVLYVAGGSGPHPTVLLLHGLPGNEQNLDCAQTVRRAGWNVLTIHYGDHGEALAPSLWRTASKMPRHHSTGCKIPPSAESSASILGAS